MARVRMINGADHPVQLADFITKHADEAEYGLAVLTKKNGTSKVRSANVTEENLAWIIALLQAQLMEGLTVVDPPEEEL